MNGYNDGNIEEKKKLDCTLTLVNPGLVRATINERILPPEQAIKASH